jgi:TfoX/Sxy family transcriptional regulator of competence genes
VRKTFGYPSAYVNGQMFSGLHNESMILKLPPEDLKTFLALEGAHPFEPMPGRPMREFAVVPPSLLHSESDLVNWLHKAFKYVGSLPPKKPKSKKKA